MKLLGKDIWGYIDHEARWRGSKRVAVAYATALDRLRLRAGDVLIVDASEGRIRNGDTSAPALLKAAQSGVTVCSKPGLHAKLYLLARTTIVCSANVSVSSGSLVELGVSSNAAPLRRKAAEWFSNLQESATVLGVKELEKLAAIPVLRRGAPPAPAAVPTLMEALLSNHESLKSYVFSWMEMEPDLPGRLVITEARKRKLVPDSLDDWDWCEWKDSRGLTSRLEKAYNGRLSVGLYATVTKEGEIKSIVGIDEHPGMFIKSIPVVYRGNRYRVVLEKALDSSPGLSLSRPGWRKSFYQALNEGLSRNPALRKRLSRRITAEITAKELRTLLGAS